MTTSKTSHTEIGAGSGQHEQNFQLIEHFPTEPSGFPSRSLQRRTLRWPGRVTPPRSRPPSYRANIPHCRRSTLSIAFVTTILSDQQQQHMITRSSGRNSRIRESVSSRAVGEGYCSFKDSLHAHYSIQSSSRCRSFCVSC